MKRLWSRFLGVISFMALCMAMLTGCSENINHQETQGKESPAAEMAETEAPSDTMETTPAEETSDIGEATPAGETSEIGDTTSAGEALDNDGTSNTGDASSAAGSPDVAGKTAADAGGIKKNKTNQSQGTGNITSKRNNNKKASVTNQQTDAASVTLNQAKEIALKKAGLSEKDGNWTKEETDREHGRKVYELEFVSRNLEYDFEIDAGSGKILEYEKDLIHD